MSPRRLEPNTAYFAFVVPTYEIGRRSGLGEEIAATLSGLDVAWPTAREYPIYHEWYFRTAERGDFEELVRRLKPRRRRRADRHPRHGRAVARLRHGRGVQPARRAGRPRGRAGGADRLAARPQPGKRFHDEARADRQRAGGPGGLAGHRRRRSGRGAADLRPLARAGRPARPDAGADELARPAQRRPALSRRRGPRLARDQEEPGSLHARGLAADRRGAARQRGDQPHPTRHAGERGDLREVGGRPCRGPGPRGHGADVCARPRQPDDDPPPCRREPADERGLLRFVPQADAAAWLGGTPLLRQSRRCGAARLGGPRGQRGPRDGRPAEAGAHHRHMGVGGRRTGLRHSRLAEAAPQEHGAPGDPRNRADPVRLRDPRVAELPSSPAHSDCFCGSGGDRRARHTRRQARRAAQRGRGARSGQHHARGHRRGAGASRFCAPRAGRHHAACGRAVGCGDRRQLPRRADRLRRRLRQAAGGGAAAARLRPRRWRTAR